ncbi:NAD(P)-binding domain-containing protein [Microbacterium lacticum]|uniref:NADPH-dependent F420 reductase n=1 Tax=Microbacterium lacticum TaxID=33885 RepID=UPI003A845239
MNVSADSRGVIGIIGAGKSGVAIARLALDAGYTVKIASSGPARDTAVMTDIVSPGAIAVDIADLADGVDIVVLAVPLRRFRDLPLHLLAGHTVIDVMNYWPPIDGRLPDFESTDRPSSVIVQDALPSSIVVKTFNHLGYHQMEDLARPAGTPGRVGLGVASDDIAATVMEFVDSVGFDPVHIGTLNDSVLLQPETSLFGTALNASDIEDQLLITVN